MTEGQAHRVALAAELARGAESGALSGEALGRRLGISRAAVQKHMLQLRDLGFVIAAVAGAGYRLNRPFSDLLVVEAVLPYLLEEAGEIAGASPWIAGLPYRYVEHCASTNLLLRENVTSLPAGTVLVTEQQTGGRGRLGRGWVSLPGKDLTFSLLVRPALAPARAHLLSLAAALAVAETLEGFENLRPGGPAGGSEPRRVGIKWPNDVMLGSNKVCGILLEGAMDADRLQWAIIGIGLNVNSDPAALLQSLPPGERQQWTGRPRPTSLGEAFGVEVPRALLLARLLCALTRELRRLDGDQGGAGGNQGGAGGNQGGAGGNQGGAGGDQGGAGELLRRLAGRDVLKGREVQVFSGPALDRPFVAGEAFGVGPEGQLLVRTHDGVLVPVFAGDVTLRPL